MLQRHTLNGPAFAYIRENLDEKLEREYTLAHYLLHLPLEQGEVFTYAPLHHYELTDFWGSLYAAAPDEHGEMKRLIASLIDEFLQAAPDHCVLVEDFIVRFTDPAIVEETQPVFNYHQEVYYPLFPGKQTVEDIESTLRTQLSPLFLGVLSSSHRLVPAQRYALTKEDLEEIAQHAQTLVIGAYDYEGYLLWNRVRENHN